MSSVSAGDTITAALINSAIYKFQRPPGTVETGHYVAGGNAYAAGTVVSCVVVTQNRFSTPVSGSIDTADISPTAGASAPSIAHVVAGGCQIWTSSSISLVVEVGGNFTIHF